MTPLPLRRERRYGMPTGARYDRETWGGREVHPGMPGPIRQIAVLIFLLLAVMAMILLFAELAR